jgi:hypothetical protein
VADFSLARSTSIDDPNTGSPPQQPTIELSPPTPAPGDADAGVASARPESASLTAKQKRELVAGLLKATPEKPNRQVAVIVGVTHKVVARVRAEMEAAGQIAQLTTTTIGKDDKVRTAKSQQEAARRAWKVKVHIYDSQPPTAEPNAQQVQPATAEDLGNQQTIEQLALRVWAAIVADKVLGAMSSLMDELIQSPLLVDDDDEEVDEDSLDDHLKREKKILAEAIEDALETYPDINSINSLPLSSDPDIARDAEQLRDVLTRCSIGATEFAARFSEPQLERMVKLNLKRQFKEDPKYSRHIREDVPGSDIKNFGKRGRTSSAGTFYKSADYLSGGGLAALLNNGWVRVCKDRLDPVAWSHQYGMERKTERQAWRHHYVVTERNGKQSRFELPREKLAGNGATAIRSLMKSGVHVVTGADTQEALVRYLRFRPRQEIIRMPQVGFFEVNGHYLCVRSNETLLHPLLRKLNGIVYAVDNASDPDQYGHQIKGTTTDWQTALVIPLRGNSNVALALATSFASALIPFCDEQRGGVHIFGQTGIGKSLAASVGESVYGLPCASQHPRSYGRTWGVTLTGLEDLLRFRNHAGLFLDELQRVPRESRGIVVQQIYSFTQVQKARGGAWRLRDDGAGQVFLLSSGEDPIAAFVGKEDREGRERRVPDIPAEVQNQSAFETLDHDEVEEKLPGFYRATMQYHGAAGRDWQQWLVEHSAELKERIEQERQAFLALLQVRDVARRAQPQLHSIIRRFALYAASLRLAIDANILPWTVAEADAGLIAVLERWVKQRGNSEPVSTQSRVAEFLRRLADDLAERFILLHKVKGRFVPATDSDVAKLAERRNFPSACDGYIKDDLVLIRPEAWVKRAGTDHEEIARYFHARGDLLTRDDGKFSMTVSTIGGSERVYAVRRAALIASDTSDTSDTGK